MDYPIGTMKKAIRTRPVTYRGAGVDVDEGNRLVKLIKSHVRSTYRPEVIGDIGGFGALFSARFKSMKDPVLVSSTDGVGTKLKVAFMTDRHDTVGIDLVAMSVNDILVSGAEPLFFLDYFATGKLSARKAALVVKGIADGCRQAGCALIGGETAEMPGLYAPGEYDLAGFAVGVVDRERIIDGRRIKAGDTIIGLASSGLHSNGFSLARKVLFDVMKLKIGGKPRGFKRSIGQTLITPTRIYVKPALKLMSSVDILGMAHITGGGFIDNIPRVVPDRLKSVIYNNSWNVPQVFRLIQSGGRVAESEMLRTFNCGIGMIMVVRKKDEVTALKNLKSMDVEAFVIGEIAAKKGKDRDVEFIGSPIF